MRARLTSEPDDRICLESGYDPTFVDRLKAAIPYGGREWSPDRKRWLISALYAAELLDFLKSWGAQVQDDRATADTPVAVPPMPDDLRAAYDALHLAYTAPLCVAEASYRALVKYYHPDIGGNADDFCRVGDAIATIRSYLDPKIEGIPF